MTIDRLRPVIRKLIGITVMLFAAATATLAADEAPPLAGMALVEALRLGGYSIYFRHEATDWSQHDSVRQRDDWLSCDPARIRQLSEAGRKSARETGAALRALGIPVGRVYASPYCRTMETARLMGLGEVEASDAVMNLRVAEYFGGRDAIVATARDLLARPPGAGVNTVVVAHGNVAINATSVYPDEGEGLVFRADGNSGFVFVGRLTAGEWRRLALGE